MIGGVQKANKIVHRIVMKEYRDDRRGRILQNTDHLKVQAIATWYYKQSSGPNEIEGSYETAEMFAQNVTC